MWETIVQGFQVVMGLFSFGSKVQDEKNTAAEREQVQAGRKISTQSQINTDENKAASTGDDADFGRGL